MENGNRPDRPKDFTREAWSRIVDEVDKLTPSPTERARKVWEVLREGEAFDVNQIDNYDITCFCIWYLSFMTDGLPYIKPLAKHLNIIFHRFHYQAAEELGLINQQINKENEPIREEPEKRSKGLELLRNYFKKR